MSSSNDEFKIQIPRKIEPNIITCFDVFAKEDDSNEERLGDTLQVLSVRDEEFYVDKCNPKAHIDSINRAK
jgi:hypothetical protein